MHIASTILSVVAAAALLFSGLIHAAQPYYFVHTIASYRLLPAEASGLLGVWLPYLQIVLAICIILQLHDKAALYLAALVFAAFAFAQIAVLVRGMEIDCGCFGFVARAVSPASAALPVLLMTACALVLGVRHGVRPIAFGSRGTAAE